MIQEFVNAFMAGKDAMEHRYVSAPPSCYEDIVKDVFKMINPGEAYGKPDPGKVHVIDDGDYQGTLLFVIPEKMYQPSRYWSVFVDYGSCSGCDTFERISEGEDAASRAKDYITLALHIVQNIREVGGKE